MSDLDGDLAEPMYVATCHQAGSMFIGVYFVLVFVSFAEGLALCVCVCVSKCEQLSVPCVHLQACAQVRASGSVEQGWVTSLCNL